MEIDSEFEGGSIRVVGGDGDGALLALRDDSAAELRQWFSFAALGRAGVRRRFVIANADEASYPDAWEDYRVLASYDRKRWFRVATRYRGGRLEFSHRAAESVCHYAYFAPYSSSRREGLLRRMRRAGASVRRLGWSVEGRELKAVVVGSPKRRARRLWMLARQHPGETGAEWFMEGVLRRLLGLDAGVRELLSSARLYLVPCMNPDGAALGNLRTNAAGQDLNRCWLNPDGDAPEVAAVRRTMERSGVDLLLDVHADERNPYCFLAGCEGNPGYSERLRALENQFEQALCEAFPDFQDELGYERDAPGGADLSSAANFAGEAFDCLSFTLETPFKDLQAPRRAPWMPHRAMELGAASLDAVLSCLDDLRE